jgi:hypothetical protein
MGLRSWWRDRRPDAPVGRHSVGAPPVVPGAAASLVAQAATVELVAAASVPAPVHVTLGFADGGTVELPDDDPRVRTFRAAAAAIVDPR